LFVLVSAYVSTCARLCSILSFRVHVKLLYRIVSCVFNGFISARQHICITRYMLSPVRPSLCQMPSSVHTGSRLLVVNVVEFHAHVTVQRWYGYETSKNGTKSPWYEGYEKSMVRKVHKWYETSMVRIVYGTKSLVPLSTYRLCHYIVLGFIRLVNFVSV